MNPLDIILITFLRGALAFACILCAAERGWALAIPLGLAFVISLLPPRRR